MKAGHRVWIRALFGVGISIATLSASPPSTGAVLVEDGGRPTTRAAVKTGKDGLELRRVRRAGVGFSVAGPLGVGGVNLELNFVPQVGIVAGYGGGPGYQAFTLQIKKILGGKSFMPYIAGGYSRWTGHSEPGRPIGTTNPGFLRNRFLNDRQRKEGPFTENLIYPALGLQYVQLAGMGTGSSIFTELVMLADIDDLVGAPTATLGYLYYF